MVILSFGLLKDVAVVKIEEDETWDANITILKEFYFKHIFPKIVGGALYFFSLTDMHKAFYPRVLVELFQAVTFLQQCQCHHCPCKDLVNVLDYWAKFLRDKNKIVN